MPDLRDQLQEIFGLDEFRPRQRDVIEDVLARRDVLCVMPTGAGKSLCYQLPAVVLKGLTIVISPLISLMEDQVQQMRDEEVPAAYLNSTLSPDLQRQVLSEVAGGFEGLLYVAPERFASEAFRAILPDLKVNLLAIDEAHCISMWGHDFRPDYAGIGRVRKMLGNPPTVALTATATEDVRADIIQLLQLREPSIVITGFDRTNLRYECQSFDKKAAKDEELINYVSKQDGSGIVYCSTRKAVDAITAVLSSRLRDRLVVAYHAGMDTGSRSRNQEAWMNTPRAVAVATNAFGMGINKPNVRFVLHYNMPGTLEAYYQEAGRAGRDGQLSRCMLFYHFEDTRTQEFFIKNIGEDRPASEADLVARLKARAQQKLKLMEKYIMRSACRRQQILDYFGDEGDVIDCQCDICKPNEIHQLAMAEMSEDVITQVRQLLSAVARLNGRFGFFTVGEMLAGESSERVVKWQLDQFKLFGVFRDAGMKKVVAALHRLGDAGLIQQVEKESEVRVIELTSAGVKVMKAEERPPVSLADLNLHKRAKASRSSSRTRSSRGGKEKLSIEDDAQLDPEAQSRFSRLRALRADLARAADLPAYCVLHDATMKRIATHCPENLATLEAVKGMGPFKVKLYGQAILEALKSE